MSKNNSNVPSDPKASSGAQGEGDLYSPFSAQPTSFIETTFAGSLGISMHNEVSGQQSARPSWFKTRIALCACGCANLHLAANIMRETHDDQVGVARSGREVERCELPSDRFGRIGGIWRRRASADESRKACDNRKSAHNLPPIDRSNWRQTISGADQGKPLLVHTTVMQAHFAPWAMS